MVFAGIPTVLPGSLVDWCLLFVSWPSFSVQWLGTFTGGSLRNSGLVAGVKRTVLAYSTWVVVSNIFYFHPYLGKILILTNIFQMGWNHQYSPYRTPYSSEFFLIVGSQPHADMRWWVAVWHQVLGPKKVKEHVLFFCGILLKWLFHQFL